MMLSCRNKVLCLQLRLLARTDTVWCSFRKDRARLDIQCDLERALSTEGEAARNHPRGINASFFHIGFIEANYRGIDYWLVGSLISFTDGFDSHSRNQFRLPH